MLLNVLVSYTRDAFVAIDKPRNLKVFPYGGVHIRVSFGSYLLLCFFVWIGFGWGEQACTELFEGNGEGRRQRGEETGVEVKRVRRKHGGAEPKKIWLEKGHRSDAGQLTLQEVPMLYTIPSNMTQDPSAPPVTG